MQKAPEESILDNLYIAAPCSMKWESMQGDERKRSCNGCSRNVFNISDMTKQEAESFLRENGTSQCMTFYRRKDGTIMTDNCPVGMRKLRDRCRVVVRAVAGVLTLLMSASAAMAQSGKANSTKCAASSEVVNGRPMAPGFAGSDDRALGGAPAFLGSVAAPARPQAPDPKATEQVSLVRGKPGVTPVEPGRKVHHQHDKVKVKLRAEKVIYLDRAAMDAFQKGQECLNRGQLGLAEGHFTRALGFFDAQENGDKKFREAIENSLRAVQSKSQ